VRRRKMSRFYATGKEAETALEAPGLRAEEASGRTILIINEKPEALTEVHAILNEDGYRVLGSRNCPEALNLIRKERVDLVLLDIAKVVEEGVDAWEEIRREFPELPVVTVSFS